MDYDYRNRVGPPPPSLYRQSTTTTTSNHPMMYGHQHQQQQPLYPKIGQPGHPPPPARTSSSHHQTSAPSSPAGLGIRVSIKPEYRITPPPQLSPFVGDIPRSTFHFEFEFEKKILAEAEKDQNWSRFFENPPSKATEATSSQGSGLNRDVVSLAIANYGDNPTKVEEFVKGYNLLIEMGFSSNKVAEALAMYDNDTDKALAYFLNSSS